MAMRASRLILVYSLLATALTACAPRYDAPKWMLQSPDLQLHAVRTLNPEAPYRVRSETRLRSKKSKSVREQPTALIESGTVGNWSWEVRAVPSLVGSWEAWKRDKRFRERLQAPGDWSHSAVTWQQAFERAYKITTYLLGRTPPPMKATILLVPSGSSYHQVFQETGSDSVPLTFGFYYPSGESDDLEVTSARFSALVEAVSTTIHEYQHILSDTKVTATVGASEADQKINDESRSICWKHATVLALTSGTHSSLTWDPAESGNQPGQKPIGASRKISDAFTLGMQLELTSLFAYLTERGIRDGAVQSTDPAAMNAVFSFCRAMTQHPRDLTAGPYPSKEIEYVPLLPLKPAETPSKTAQD